MGDSTTSKRKHANECESSPGNCKDSKIKQDFQLRPNPFLGYTIWDVLENKTNATSHPNIGSFETIIKEKWDEMSEEFILKACKSIRRRVDTIIEKMVAILSKFTVLDLSFFFFAFVYFLNWN